MILIKVLAVLEVPDWILKFDPNDMALVSWQFAIFLLEEIIRMQEVHYYYLSCSQSDNNDTCHLVFI